MRRVLFLLLVIFLPAAALAQGYQSKELAEAAATYRRELLDSIPADQRQPTLIARLRREADEDYRAKRYSRAIDSLTRAIASGADDGLIWLRLAQNMAAIGDPHMPASAYNAYVKSTDPVERGVALFLIGRDYDRHDKHKDALAAFEAGLALTQSAAVSERVEQLKRLVAFRVAKVQVEAESESPNACLRFNEKIATTGDVSHAAFVRSDPAFDGVVTVRGDTLCVNGLKHGETYELRVLAGFPAETGERTAETFTTRVVVPDRRPSISFAGTGYVLPQRDTAGLPVTTVNLDRVKVRLLRVNERNLVPSLDAEKFAMKFDSYDVDQIIERTGRLVWEGEMAIAGRRNVPVTTAIPLKDMLRDNGPGVYLAVVERPDLRASDFERPATNWVLVSDLGLIAYSAADEMIVAVRSLATAQPLSGVSLRLYARNNSELANATSGADGLARIPGGLLRGSGGDEPFAVMAYGKDGDFNFLEVGRPAFDLSDRGVTGRKQPGPVDAYLYTDRGIYRPGETVHLVGLVRDEGATAIASLAVTARLLRPDGVEVDRRQITGDRLGAYELTYPLARDARIGSWRVEFRLDPKSPPVGMAEFRVEDFVPPQLKVALSAGDGPIVPGEAYPIEVQASFYYGAPGADLAVEAEATVAFDEAPFPNEPGFRFGLAGEEFAGTRQDVEAPPTDSDGRSTATVVLSDIPDLTKPLAASVRISVVEPSGRTVTETVTRPIRQRALAIGLRAPQGDDAVPEGQESSVEIIAVDPDGKRIAAKGLRWELLRESWQYDWYSVNGVWRHRRQVRDTPIETGALDIAADAPGSLSRNLPPGRYRWEVTDAGSGAQSSLRFHVGWWVAAELPDVPDRLEATADKASYRPGETAKLFVKAPFAGEAEIAIASDRILAMRSIALPEGGTTVEIPVGSDWGSGVYALVSGYRPSALTGPTPRGPGRAVGVAWFGVDPAPRTLGVTLSAPAVVRPRGPLDIAVKVDGIAGGEEAFITVAAVDEAVLKLTEFDSPAPEKYFYGKRRLGVELRDIYGRLIDPRAGGIGVLRSGGDQFARRSVAGLPDKSSRVVALFSGPVRVGDDGTASVRFDVPDFQGELRVMAVAYGARKLGSGTAAITVRDPVVTLVALPRFLAPGDSARIGVVVNNLEGEAGDYRLTLAATGAGSFAAPIDRPVPLAAGQRFSDGFTLSAATPGNIALKLELTGPAGLRIARDFTIGVRPAQSYQLRRFVGRLEPGQSVTLDDNAADAFLPGTGEAFLTVSPRPDWDVPGLLRALDRYAYGCLEQTTSRALPLLYVDTVAGLWRTDPGFSPGETVDRAIGRAVELQRADGSFGVWSDTDDTVPWLNAYASDFLIRAREHGRNVPDFAIRAALGWLRDYVRREHTRVEALPAIAYAHYVLARGGMGDVPTLRYFNDTQLAKLPTQLAKAQLGAALAQAGDVTRANAAYDAALGPPQRPAGLRFVDFGSDLRDSAAVLAFTAGNPARTPRLTEVMDRVAELFARANRTSTQEQAWLLMAAEAAVRESGGTMTIATGNEPPQTGDKPLFLRRELGGGAAPVTIANRGTTPAWRTVSLSGVPKAELPEEASGYAVSRAVFRRDGTPADLSQVRQGERFVVVITGSRADPARAARALVIDLLPAGFEIESAMPAGGSPQPGYSWLKSTTTTAYTEARDDRYVSALDLSEGRKDFTLAYVVRAVTPGEFVYPALVVEDMYDPETLGRTAIARLAVAPQ